MFIQQNTSTVYNKLTIGSSSIPKLNQFGEIKVSRKCDEY